MADESSDHLRAPITRGLSQMSARGEFGQRWAETETRFQSVEQAADSGPREWRTTDMRQKEREV